MKYLLIPIEKTHTKNSDDGNIFIPAIVINMITMIFLAISLTSEYIPNLHGLGRFVLCSLFVIIGLLLTFIPVIGDIISIGIGILWIYILWNLTDGISVD